MCRGHWPKSTGPCSEIRGPRSPVRGPTIRSAVRRSDPRSDDPIRGPRSAASCTGTTKIDMAARRRSPRDPQRSFHRAAARWPGVCQKITYTVKSAGNLTDTVRRGWCRRIAGTISGQSVSGPPAIGSKIASKNPKISILGPSRVSAGRGSRTLFLSNIHWNFPMSFNCLI